MPWIPLIVLAVCAFLYFALAKFLACKDQAEYDIVNEEYEEAKRKWPQGSTYVHLPPQRWHELGPPDQPRTGM